MGTHPIFESDFDCLTDGSDVNDLMGAGILDKYELGGVVGEGSYGTVHKARNRENGRTVAIKKFIEDDQTTLKVAQRELRALRRLRHENLVNMLEFTRKRRRLYIIFEFVDGNVLDYLESQPKRHIEPLIAKEIIWQLLRALEFMHQHRMIHRDVKPENVLYAREWGVAKLCDFGFARPCAVINGERFTDYVATRWYRAPELLVKELLYESSVDVWAVGCLLPEMLSGDALFPGESDLDQLHQVLSVRGYLPKHLAETFSKSPDFYGVLLPEPKHVALERHCPMLAQLKDVKLFVERALTLDPDYRPSCGELLQSDYFGDEEFLQRKIVLQEKITRFNLPYKAKCTKNIDKSSSTSKLTHRRNPYHAKQNYEYKEKNEVKSMPDIQTHNKTVYVAKHAKQKSNLTKLPKL